MLLHTYTVAVFLFPAVCLGLLTFFFMFCSSFSHTDSYLPYPRQISKKWLNAWSSKNRNAEPVKVKVLLLQLDSAGSHVNLPRPGPVKRQESWARNGLQGQEGSVGTQILFLEACLRKEGVSHTWLEGSLPKEDWEERPQSIEKVGMGLLAKGKEEDKGWQYLSHCNNRSQIWGWISVR